MSEIPKDGNDRLGHLGVVRGGDDVRASADRARRLDLRPVFQEVSEIPETMTTREVLQEIEAILADFYTPLEAEQWWNSPHPRFNGALPSAMVDDSLAGDLLTSLRQLNEAVYL